MFLSKSVYRNPKIGDKVKIKSLQELIKLFGADWKIPFGGNDHKYTFCDNKTIYTVCSIEEGQFLNEESYRRILLKDVGFFTEKLYSWSEECLILVESVDSDITSKVHSILKGEKNVKNI